MRVTNSMIAGRVTYNTQNSISRFLRLQTQMSTGKRINKPSDDPLGITQDLDYRNELAKNKQYQGNITSAKSWYTKFENMFAEFNAMSIRDKDLAVRAADETNTSGLATFKLRIDSSINQLLDFANEELTGRSMFAGYKTDQPAFKAHSNGVTFQGDDGVINFQIDSNVDHTVNLNGADMFLKPFLTLGEGFDLNAGITGATELVDLHNGAGVNLTPGIIEINDLNLGINTTINLSTETTIDDVIAHINADLPALGITNLTVRIADDNSSLMFEATQNGLISGATPLNNINSGAGIDMGGGLLRVSNDSGIDFNVDISSASTIDDVITQFNSQLGAAGILGVTMGINAAGTGLEINDTNGVPLDLTISNHESEGNIAEQLGLTGKIGPTLTGKDLAPQVHFAIGESGGGTTAEDLGILTEFNGNHVGENLDVQLLPSTNISDLNIGLGIPKGKIVMWQGDTKAVLDLDDPSLVTVQDMLDAFNNSGLDITASLNSDNRGIQVVNNDRYSSFTIEDVSKDGTVSKDLGIFGSPDLFGSYFVLNNALNNEDQEAVGRLLENLNLGFDHALNVGTINNSRDVRLTNTSQKLFSQEFMYVSRLSALEDADLTKVITDLSIFENNYQAALMASAKIIQPTLLNFLR